MSKVLLKPLDAYEKVKEDANSYIIDARSQEVYTGGNNQISGAYHLSEQMAKEVYLDLPKNKEYFIYTTQGEEDLSERFAQFLREKGFEAYAIEGGYETWRDNGLPIEPIRAKGTPFLDMD